MPKLKGLSFPIKFSPRGSLTTSEGVDKIKENIKAIALTSLGERLMSPNVGTMGYTHLFRNMGEGELGLLKHHLRLGIEAGENRVTILDVNISRPEQDGQLLVSLSFQIITSTEFDNLSFYI
jgi:phage baseplate assembly protein W